MEAKVAETAGWVWGVNAERARSAETGSSGRPSTERATAAGLDSTSVAASAFDPVDRPSD